MSSFAVRRLLLVAGVVVVAALTLARETASQTDDYLCNKELAWLQLRLAHE